MKRRGAIDMDVLGAVGYSITAIAVILLAIIGLRSCNKNSSPNQETLRYYTVTVDGHWFVVPNGFDGGACHHPDCPKCIKPEDVDVRDGRR